MTRAFKINKRNKRSNPIWMHTNLILFDSFLINLVKKLILKCMGYSTTAKKLYLKREAHNLFDIIIDFWVFDFLAIFFFKISKLIISK